MQIRITADLVCCGSLQLTRGQVIDLPAELAQQFIDDLSAEASALPEYAALSAQGFVPAPARPQNRLTSKLKGRR